jgi:hypothetical protein
VATLGFIVGQSEVVLIIEQITDEGMFSFEETSRISHDNWRITQHYNTDDIEKTPEAQAFIGDTQITGFTYSIPLSVTNAWGDELEVDWRVKLQYALDTRTTLPYVDIGEREEREQGESPDNAWLIKEIDYDD